jgi:hypothetical protein
VVHEGFRPRGAGQHWTIVRFCQEALGQENRQQVALFAQMRRKRHRFVYEMAGLVSRQETEQALVFARASLKNISLWITGQPRSGTGQT